MHVVLVNEHPRSFTGFVGFRALVIEQQLILDSFGNYCSEQCIYSSYNLSQTEINTYQIVKLHITSTG